MDGFGSGQMSYGGGERGLEIVGGRGISGVNGSQINAVETGNQSPVKRPTNPHRRSHGSSKAWGLSDPEMKRKKWIAGYKFYGVEAKFKDSFKAGLRWIRNKCSRIVHGS
ncbi:DUF3511 domain-containing protein [Cephalotus follicularis]|uniref:DUF3511 domain-containing protein n=1 Tax=Cephalotus follicularis TaxID=3775 RepID=A0A1Q3ANA5_CEPFO|nr:DUF3511 domain-containing protein [Cephalotus follicularis]